MKHAPKLGFYSALVALIAAAGYAVVQILQVVGVLKYPADAILIYGFSLFIPVPFLLSLLALHYGTSEDKRIWTHAALLFSAIYAMYVSLNYIVQLATVIPMTLQGKLDEVRILDQTPHSLFWDVDALGYFFMGFATLFASFVFSKHGREKWIRGFLLANALVTPITAFVYFYPKFSNTLLLLATPWLVTSTGSMLMLMLYFRGKLAEE